MPRLIRITLLMIVVLAVSPPGIGQPQEEGASWLKGPKLPSWNQPGMSVPAAPKIEEPGDPRCREQARPAQLEEDKRVREQGWDLAGAYQGGWQILVIRGRPAMTECAGHSSIRTSSLYAACSPGRSRHDPWIAAPTAPLGEYFFRAGAG